MKKKFLALIMVALFLAVMPVVKAAEEPTYVDDRTIATKPLFFANGTPITIEERTDGEEGALIKWNGGEKLVTKNTNIYGAGHESDTRYETTSITMNGGNVNDIFGGGLHKSNVGTVNIIINEGTYNSVSGGGSASGGSTNCSHKYNGDVNQSPTRVEKVTIIINGGTSATTVFGGGEGISYTETANIIINDGKMNWVTAGGSNGYTGKASISVLGGTITTLQSVNRGSMETTDMTVKGGKITDLVGGTKGTGTIDSVKIAVEGGDVANLLVGTIGEARNSAKDVVKVSYNKKYVENVDERTFNEDAIMQTVTLTFVAEGESESIEVPYGIAFSQEEVDELINTLKEELKAEGYTIDDFYQDEALTTKYNLTKPIEEDTTIYMKLVELKSETPAPQEVKNAKTGDMNLIMVLSLLGVAGAAVVVTGKKVFLSNNI